MDVYGAVLEGWRLNDNEAVFKCGASLKLLGAFWPLKTRRILKFGPTHCSIRFTQSHLDLKVPPSCISSHWHNTRIPQLEESLNRTAK